MKIEIDIDEKYSNTEVVIRANKLDYDSHDAYGEHANRCAQKR